MDHRGNIPIAWIGLLFLIAIGLVSYGLRSTSGGNDIPSLAGSNSRPVDLDAAPKAPPLDRRDGPPVQER